MENANAMPNLDKLLEIGKADPRMKILIHAGISALAAGIDAFQEYEESWVLESRIRYALEAAAKCLVKRGESMGLF